MKKIGKIGLALALLVGFTSCGAKDDQSKSSSNENSKQAQAQDRLKDKDTIKIGFVGENVDEWNVVKKNFKEKTGKDLEFVPFSDYNQPNEALDSGDIDLNAFQHKKFLEDYNKAHGTDIVSIGDTVLAPIGIYSNKIKSLDEIKDGDIIAIPDDPTNEARALFLLQSAGLIKVKGEEGDAISLEDITENPKNLQIKELGADQTARNLDDVTASCINSGFAVDAGFLPTKDAIYLEDHTDPKKDIYVNIIAARREDADSQTLKDLVKNFYQTDEVKKSIEERSKGSEIPAWK